MAFRILSFDELELLTENQRKSYEEELAIYNERVKFVEQMEKFENAVIKPYEPKLAAIPAVCGVPEGEFEKPEYEFVKIAPFTKPKSNVAEFRFDGSVTVIVPGYTKMKNVPVGHVKNVERDKPVLPIISKAAAPVNSFAMAEQQRPTLPESVKIRIPGSTFNILEQTSPNLPVVVKPQNFAESVFMPVVIGGSAMPVKNPKLAAPVMEVPAFTAPEIALSMLPRPEVEFPVVSVMESLELTDPFMPKVIVAKQMDVSWKQAAEIKAELPETFGITVIKVSFCEPDIQKTKLPTVQKAEIPTREFRAAKHSVYEFPMVNIPKADVLVFTAPEFEKPEVQAVVKPAVSPSLSFTVPEFEKPEVQAVVKPAVSPSLSFTVPEFEKPEVQAVVKPTVNPSLSFTVPEFEKPTVQTMVKPVEIPKLNDGKMSVNSTPRIKYPSINVLSVKSFEKVHSKVSGLPIIHTAHSPDDCTEDLLKIRLSMQKEYGTREEGFA